MNRKILKAYLGSLLFLLITTGCVQTTESGVLLDTSNQVSSGIDATITNRSTSDQASFNSTIDTPYPLEAGNLIKTPDNPGVFRLNADGVRQHIFDWPTFLAFGFNPDAIITIEASAMKDIPAIGELTRLIEDEDGTRYWVANAMRWHIEAWDNVIGQKEYFDVLPTLADAQLLSRLPLMDSLPDNLGLRDSGNFYWYTNNQHYRLADQTVVDAYELSAANTIEIPPGITDGTERTLTQFLHFGAQPGVIFIVDGGQRFITNRQALAKLGYTPKKFSTVTADFLQGLQNGLQITVVASGANLRTGPSTETLVVDITAGNTTYTPLARNDDGTWFLVMHNDTPVWIASSVVEITGSIAYLPIELADLTVGEQTEKIEVSTEETTTGPQPIICDEVPIRGFGKVWADNPEIQPFLGCPNTWQAGEHATNAAVQLFEHGTIIWLEQDRVSGGDPVYVLFNDDHSFQWFRDIGSADPEKVGKIDEGFYQIGDRFSKVYWEGTGAKVKERLGRAVSEASDSAGAFQTFNQGRMFWIDKIDAIFVIYDYGYRDSNKVWQEVKLWNYYANTF